MEILTQHVGDYLLWGFGCYGVSIFLFGPVSLHDVVAETGGFRHLIQVFFLVERVDTLVPLEGLAFGLQKVMTVWLEVVVHHPVAETFAVAHGGGWLGLPLGWLYHLTTIIIVVKRGRLDIIALQKEFVWGSRQRRCSRRHFSGQWDPYCIICTTINVQICPLLASSPVIQSQTCQNCNQTWILESPLFALSLTTRNRTRLLRRTRWIVRVGLAVSNLFLFFVYSSQSIIF